MYQYRNPLANEPSRLSAKERRKAGRSTTVKLNLATPQADGSTEDAGASRSRSWFAPIDTGRVSVSHKRRRDVAAREEEESKKEISSKFSAFHFQYKLKFLIGVQ
jgi:hypothetical protein